MDICVELKKIIADVETLVKNQNIVDEETKNNLFLTIFDSKEELVQEILGDVVYEEYYEEDNEEEKDEMNFYPTPKKEDDNEEFEEDDSDEEDESKVTVTVIKGYII